MERLGLPARMREPPLILISAVNLQDFLPAGEQCVGDHRTELAAAFLLEQCPDPVQRPCVFVASAAGERIEHIRDGSDASVEMDVLSGQVVGISASRPALVMLVRHDGGRLEQWTAGLVQDVIANFGMRPDDCEFLRSKLAGLS